MGFQWFADFTISLACSAGSQANVGSFYQTILQRSIDPGSLAKILSSLASGVVTTNDVRGAVASSPEAVSVLNGIFQTELSRPASSADVSFYQTDAAAGAVTATGIQGLLAGLTEAHNDILTFGENILGRAIDPTFYEGLLAAGSSQAVVVADIAYSAEAQTHVNFIPHGSGTSYCDT